MTYTEQKERARKLALDYQQTWGLVEDLPTYYSDIIEAQEKFTKLGKRFGLLKEFKTNAII